MSRLLFNKYHKDAPANAVNIMRGTPWGNMFIIGKDGDRDEVCDRFENRIINDRSMILRIQEELYQQPLVCCCWPKRCHGETLIYIANYCRSVSIIVPSNYGEITINSKR